MICRLWSFLYQSEAQICIHFLTKNVKFQGNLKNLKLKESEWDESKTQKKRYHLLLPILDSTWLALVCELLSKCHIFAFRLPNSHSYFLWNYKMDRYSIVFLILWLSSLTFPKNTVYQVYFSLSFKMFLNIYIYSFSEQADLRLTEKNVSVPCHIDCVSRNKVPY